jgi:hypothetical protein
VVVGAADVAETVARAQAPSRHRRSTPHSRSPPSPHRVATCARPSAGNVATSARRPARHGPRSANR